MLTRKELMRMMPMNAADIAAAERIIQLGHPKIAPVMGEMLKAMRVSDSPVADAFAAYFGRLGEPAVEAIGQGLERGGAVRHRILTMVLPQWPKAAVAQLRYRLTTFATHPDAYDNDLLCMQILIRHQLADSDWLVQWLEFKRERWKARSDLLTSIEDELKE